MNNTSQCYRRKPVTVTAIRYEARAESLVAIQAFMAPCSPASDGKVLLISVRDLINEKAYPSLGRQFRFANVRDGDYIVKTEAGDLAVMSEAELLAEYELASEVTINLPPAIVATHPRALVPQD